ncbi:hypothetical protein A2W13_03380 [Candidatus Woesebacteria bacterium RBG_16_36_11]|uniref:Sodium/calcium exchanger membrane region domain-containing protein n=3 Tax=Candidatus Woeseibacteriota TaxID=1752722 RepID=A0A1F7XDK6_9BACT|nr:MAG: hypothetical protein A2Z67_00460 [Candidatus Woesebacteria bacterium RBG_13_36_22]OGM12498.1 MAG: hypothetical protein A2W13_03380 [Candidatus Woesebacteria bacterium RBG_16_36_11]OGM17379.1 MAG: hypothetical protein A2V55_00235 [Candidatus Woesebacteria bacterium RBG_19FT_COMBO_37_29]
MSFLILTISLFFLIIASNYLVKETDRLAASIRISPLIIGSTLIAFGTSLPEFSVTISSIAQKVPDLSLGNIIGSNICNIFLVLGISILFFPVRMGTQKTQRNNIILLITTLIFIAYFFVPKIYSTYLLYALVTGYALFLIIEIIWGEIGSKKEDKKALSKLKKEKSPALVTAIKLLLAIATIIISSKFLVTSAEAIALLFKIKDEIIGLTLIAFGTSIPELSTSIASGFRKDWKLIVGDIQGSNIFNLSILGTITLLYSKDGVNTLNIISLSFLALATLISFYLTRKYEGENIPRYYGLVFIAFYSSYILLIFLR